MGATWDRDPDGFAILLRVFLAFFFFFFGVGFNGDVSLRTNPPPPLEWISSPPLVSAVLLTTKGAQSPGSSRMGVIGALVIFFPSEVVQDKLHSS